MKKIYTTLILAVLALSISACSGQSPLPEDNSAKIREHDRVVREADKAITELDRDTADMETTKH